MAVIPSFSSYAPAPDLAGAFLGRERIAQQAASDAARIQLGYAQLEQEAVNNEMELAARMETNTRNALMKAQENEIEKAYRDTQIGIAQKNLQQEELATQMKLSQAAMAFDAQQQYSQAVAGGMDPHEAMRRFGFGQPGFANALGGNFQGSESAVAMTKLRSDLRNVDSEMASQRKLLEKAKETEDKNRILGRLLSLDRKRSALFSGNPTVSQPAAAGAPAMPPPPPMLQGPMPMPPGRMFMGTPQGIDPSGFPSAQPTQFIVPPPTSSAAPKQPSPGLKILRMRQKGQ